MAGWLIEGLSRLPAPQRDAGTVPTVIAGYAKNLFAVLDTDLVRGREILARFVAPVVMTPEVDGQTEAPREGKGPGRRYRPTGAFNLSFFLTGLLNEQAAQQIQVVAEVWVPFDEVIAVGWT